jgi:hypothetical protein
MKESTIDSKELDKICIYSKQINAKFLKTKRLCNPKEGNRWNPNGIHRDIAISATGTGINGKPGAMKNIYAIHGFPISGPDFRADNFQGTILYYYELKLTSSPFR